LEISIADMKLSGGAAIWHAPTKLLFSTIGKKNSIELLRLMRIYAAETTVSSFLVLTSPFSTDELQVLLFETR